MTRLGLDTNILAYLAGVRHSPLDEEKVLRAHALLASAQAASFIAPVQALGELFVVLRRKGVSADQARAILLPMADKFGPAPSETATFLSAIDLAVDHKLQLWDALIVTAAAEAGCSLLLSEDMQHGFVTRGLTIVNPFAEKPHPKLAALLKD